MRAVILQMTVSLDGYVAGPNPDNLDWGLPGRGRGRDCVET